jgi:hypothetical protein
VSSTLGLVDFADRLTELINLWEVVLVQVLAQVLAVVLVGDG